MFTLFELFNLIILTLGIGYIFSGIYKKSYGFDLEDFKLSVIVAAPAVVLHELAHKFLAILFGLQSTLHASFLGLALGIFLKSINSPFIIFIPGYVSVPPADPLITGIIALGGPIVNLILWISSILALKFIDLSQKWIIIMALTKRINIILFLFNIIPFGFFDGAKVLNGVLSLF